MSVSFRHRLAAAPARLALAASLCALALGGCGLVSSDDTRAPLVELLAPLATATTTGAPTTASLQTVRVGGVVGVRVQVTPRGTDNGVGAVRFLVDNRPAGTAAVVGTPAKNTLGQFVYTYAGTLDVSAFADGDHRFEVVAFDRFGARGTSVPLRLRIANGDPLLGPTARVTEPLAGASVKGTVRVVVAPEPGSFVDRVDFLVDGLTLATDSVAPFEWAWATRLSGVGEHRLQGRAYDGPDFALTPAVRVTVTDTTSTGGGGGGGGPVDPNPPPVGSFDPSCTVSGCIRFRAATTDPLSAPIAVDGSGNVTAVTTNARAVSWTPAGAVRWTATLPATSVVAPLAASPERTYVVTETGRLLALGATGAVVWTYDAGSRVSGGLALVSIPRCAPGCGTNDALVVFGGEDGRLHAVGVGTGASHAGFPARVSTASITTPVAVLDFDTFVVTPTDGRVYAFGANGQRKWASTESFGGLVFGPSIYGETAASSAAYNVAVVNAGGRLVVLDGRTGAVTSSAILDAAPAAAPVVGPGGRIFVLSTASLTAYRPQAGAATQLWRYSVSGTPGAPAIDALGRPYVPLSTGLDIVTTDGRLSSRQSALTGTLAAAITANGSVYTAGGSAITAFNAGASGVLTGPWHMAGASAARTHNAYDLD